MGSSLVLFLLCCVVALAESFEEGLEAWEIADLVGNREFSAVGATMVVAKSVPEEEGLPPVYHLLLKNFSQLEFFKMTEEDLIHIQTVYPPTEEQVPHPLVGEERTSFGTRIAMNKGGNIAVVGGYGSVYQYHLVNGLWSLTGYMWDAYSSHFGTSGLDISDSGTLFCVGDPARMLMKLRMGSTYIVKTSFEPGQSVKELRPQQELVSTDINGEPHMGRLCVVNQDASTILSVGKMTTLFQPNSRSKLYLQVGDSFFTAGAAVEAVHMDYSGTRLYAGSPLYRQDEGPHLGGVFQYKRPPGHGFTDEQDHWIRDKSKVRMGESVAFARDWGILAATSRHVRNERSRWVHLFQTHWDGAEMTELLSFELPTMDTDKMTHSMEDNAPGFMFPRLVFSDDATVFLVGEPYAGTMCHGRVKIYRKRGTFRQPTGLQRTKASGPVSECDEQNV